MIGANHLTDKVDGLVIATWEEAFSAHWDVDAHFVCYEAVGAGEGPWPRCNKPLLPRLRQRGADLYSNMLAFDFDLPKHRGWESREEVGDWLERLAFAAEKWSPAWEWTLFYTTRGGARLIYVPEASVPVDEAEDYHRGMCDKFAEFDLGVDQKCSDWTRVFRLPAVVRDGERTWESFAFELIPQLDVRLSLDGIPRRGAGAISQYAEIEPYDGDQPTPEVADGLLRCMNMETGRWNQTVWYKQAKKRLQGRECFDCLFNHGSLAPEGRRDSTLHKYVGQAVSMLYSLADTTPEHIYALFLEPVHQLEPDASTPDWTVKLWDHVARIWAKEDAKVRAKIEEAERLEEEVEDEFTVMVEGLKTWCDAPALYSQNEEIVREWVDRHMICSVANQYYILGHDGYYLPTAVNAGQLIAYIRGTGMHRHIETSTLSMDGARHIDVPVVQLVNRYATIATEAKAVPSAKGATIENIDTPSATIVLPAYERNPELLPHYDPDVDAWLQNFFGEDNYSKGCEWIAWSLAFEEGAIAALSIEGEQGAGKKMLYLGLRECLKVPAHATANDLVGEHQYALLKSPFLIVNEGWPTNKWAGHPADLFRHLVGGDPLTVSRKYLAPTAVVNPVRVLFLANNKNVIAELTRGRDMSVEDRNALAVRLLHFDIGSTASRWLEEKGGHRFTAQPGRRWVQGDGNQPSDYIVARHFLWLYENRGKPPGSRFLVDGNANSAVMFEMRTGTQSGRIVIETIVKMIERPAGQEPGWAIHNDRLFVLPAGVLDFYRKVLSRESVERLTIATVQSVLRGLSSFDWPAMMLPGRESYGERKWVEIDTRTLLAAAIRDGYRCPTLARLVDRQMERGIIKEQR